VTFDEYQQQAITTDTDGGAMSGLTDPAFLDKAFGLVGESGEFAEKLKKIYRDKDGELSDEDKTELVKELGDVLWYLSATLHYLGVSFDELASSNLEKVLSRKQRGVTQGSGDNR
jgi:NTP pyrophosphatase (non-canonical NTP hydrolase)